MYVYRRFTNEVKIDSRCGPAPTFSSAEEEELAKWLAEMARRGIGLKPAEFLDFMEGIVRKDKRKTLFKDGRPGYEWYYAFMARNSHMVGCRHEVPLEYSRAKLTSADMDKWYHNFREFVTAKGLLEKPERIWNADECGFAMGSKAGKVIGPVKCSDSFQVPHVTGSSSKARLTVMFCGSAGGQMMPPFLVYPSPKPAGCNPLNGASPGTVIQYTQKGWMDAVTFGKFIEHVDRHAGTERPILLIIDSLASHVDITAFSSASERYRDIPSRAKCHAPDAALRQRCVWCPENQVVPGDQAAHS